MAYDDTKWGGFAKIIVDTSTLTAGDTVRVRSMTEANAIYDKTVVTAGTPLLFETEIFKDYVKICTVQEIGGVATEIGGVYKTVDYGQTLFVQIIDKTTLRGWKDIVNSHSESSLLATGDEVDITVGTSPWTMVNAGMGIYHAHDILLVSKYLYTTGSRINGNSLDSSFYSAIAQKDRECITIRTQQTQASGSTTLQTNDRYIWSPCMQEITAGGAVPAASYITPPVQFPIFTTQGQRIKSLNGSVREWWSCDGTQQNGYGYYITTAGAGSGGRGQNDQLGLLPCFWLVADE